jgi:hypothetical protein
MRSPDVPDKITGWSHCTLHGQAAYDAWAEVTARIDAARLPFLVDLASPGTPGGEDGGEDQGDDGPGKPAKRGGRRTLVECACLPEPRRIQLTPKQIEDGPIICGLCCAPFEEPGQDPRADAGRPGLTPRMVGLVSVHMPKGPHRDGPDLTRRFGREAFNGRARDARTPTIALHTALEAPTPIRTQVRL